MLKRSKDDNVYAIAVPQWYKINNLIWKFSHFWALVKRLFESKLWYGYTSWRLLYSNSDSKNYGQLILSVLCHKSRCTMFIPLKIPHWSKINNLIWKFSHNNWPHLFIGRFKSSVRNYLHQLQTSGEKYEDLYYKA
jgi:hypothetical protein